MKPESQSLPASFLTDQERGTIHFSWVLISQSSHVCGSDSMINVTGPFDVTAKIAFLFAAENLERTRKSYEHISVEIFLGWRLHWKHHILFVSQQQLSLQLSKCNHLDTYNVQFF